MATTDKQHAKSAKQKGVSVEQIESGFNELRQQQRALSSKISELESEKKEHDLVIEALKEVSDDRKCFRMVGSVLVERTVKEVRPPLTTNCEQIGRLIDTLQNQLREKGNELNAYRKKYDIRIRGEETNKAEASDDKSSISKAAGVLVASDAKET